MSGLSDAGSPGAPRSTGAAASIGAAGSRAGTPRAPAAEPAALVAACRRFVAIDARRAASWVALAAGAVAGAASGSLEPHATMAVAWPLLAAAAAAVAAIGDLPLELLPATVLRSRRGRRWAAAWAVERALWPLAGFAAGLLPFAAHDAAARVLATALVGGVAAAATITVARLHDATAADAASLALALAGGATAATVAPQGGPAPVALAAAAAWLAGGCLAWAWSRAVATRRGEPLEFPLLAPFDRGPIAATGAARGTLALDPLPAGGPLRHLLDRLAMASALLGMAGWLMLEPEHAGNRVPAAVAWACLSLAWLVALVAPAATLQDGVAGDDAWRRIFLATPARRGPGGGAIHRFGGARPGPLRFAAGAALAQAAILGWPPLVCAIVTLPSSDRAIPPALLVAALAGAAAAIVLIVAAASAVGASRETACACLLAVALVCGAWFVAASRGVAPAAAAHAGARASQLARLAWPGKTTGC